MTDPADQYLADQEAAAKAVGVMPEDYRRLRALLSNLPPPINPVLKPGSQAILAPTDVAGTGLDTSQLTLQSSTPIGSQSSTTIGNVTPQIALVNTLADSSFDDVRQDIAISTVKVHLGTRWQVHVVLNSGVLPSVLTLTKGFDREEYTPFATSTLRITAAWKASDPASNITVYVSQIQLYPDSATALPYLVASAQLLRAGVIDVICDASQTRIEIIDANDAVLAFSPWALAKHDTLDPSEKQLTSQVAPFTVHGHTFRWRTDLDKAGSGTGVFTLDLGEPMLWFAYSADGIPFNPALGRSVSSDDFLAYYGFGL